ncbi:hypothetical protein AVEN_153823-1, partial [Araneus ventricosus]
MWGAGGDFILEKLAPRDFMEIVSSYIGVAGLEKVEGEQPSAVLCGLFSYLEESS